MVCKLLYRFNKWFEIHLGWFFVNPHKQDRWYKYLNNKYNKEKK
jgi:hypothetical protein